MASAGKTAFKSREEYKRAKELEEARKAGTAAPEVDEHGNDINPHIPQYISEVPWYVPSKGPTLKHQRNNLASERNFDKLGTWYARGQRAGPVATKYRKGACENCGAMTHVRKDCLERPRAKGAKWTGDGIARDDVIGNVNLDWEGKRDRWNGYNSNSYRNVQERYTKVERERALLRAEKLDQRLRNRSESRLKNGANITGDNQNDIENESNSEDDEKTSFRQSNPGEVVIQQTENGTPATVRNLRIREDTAKYLRNLDVNSAYYDPKTRSMRADPTPNIGAEDKDFAGDNFIRYSGDVRDLARMELHALKAAEEGRDLPHLLAEPTMAEEVFHDFASRKSAIEDRRRAQIRERYGGEEYIAKDANVSIVQESEVYIEYNREGQVVTGNEVRRASSKFTEDVCENNHTSVWGSFYKDGAWGYDCCHQMSRSAYCTGEAGKKAAKELDEEMIIKTAAALKARVAASEQLMNKAANAGINFSEKRRNLNLSESAGEKRRKLETAVRSLDAEDATFELDDHRRSYNSSVAHQDVTEEELEAFQIRKQLADDPMRHLISSTYQPGN